MKRLFSAALALSVLVSCATIGASAGSASQAQAALPGDLDGGFGKRGVATVALGRGDRERATAVARQPDGKLVVAGMAGRTGFLARFHPGGSLDRNFGTGGSVTTAPTSWSRVAVDGVHLVTVGTDGSAVVVARFHLDGSIDQGFGTEGIYRFDPEPGLPGGLPALAVTGLAVADGRITVAGVPDRCVDDPWREEYSSCHDPFVVALTRDGRLDETYGKSGVLRIDAARERRSVALLPDGRAVSVATDFTGDGDPVDWSSYTHARFFTAAGQPDLSVGKQRDGHVLLPIPFGRQGVPISAALDHRGRIVLAQDILYRFRRDGKVDMTNYLASDEGLISVDGLAIDARNRPVLAGHSLRRGTLRTWVVRLSADGSLDPALSNDGVALGRRFGPVSDRDSLRLRPVGIVPGRGGTWLMVGTEKRGKKLRVTVSAHLGGERRVPRCFGQRVTWLGTNGPDRVRRGNGIVAGLGGDDRIKVKSGAVCGGPGNDRITGSAKQVDGGSGDDVIRYTGRTYPGITSRISNWLSGGPGDDTILGSGVNDSIRGGTGNDTLKGFRGRDRIHGGPGRDSIMGGAGYDRLVGGPGRDRIDAGTGESPRTYYRGKRRGVWIELRRRGNHLKEVRIRAWEKCDGSRRSRGEFQVTGPIRIHPRTGKFRLRAGHGNPDDGIEQLIGRFKGDRVTGTYEYFDPGWDWTQTCRIVAGPQIGTVKFRARRVSPPRDEVRP